MICNLSHYARPKFCPGYVSQSPTLSPRGPSFPRPESCRDDRIYFALYLLTDIYGKSDTSYKIVNTLSGDEIEKSGNLSSNSEYIFEQCLPCGQYTFTLFDKYGDGIMYPGGFSLHIDGELIESSWRKDNEGIDKIGKALSTTFTGTGTASKCSFAPSQLPTILPTSSPKPTFITRHPSNIPSDHPSIYSSNKPSSPPTTFSCPRNDLFFELTIMTDYYSEDTSILIFNIERNENVFETKDFKRKTLYEFKVCIPCGPYELRIKDSYGDGIEDGYYNMRIDGIYLVFGGLVTGKGITQIFGRDNCATNSPTESPTYTPLPTSSPSTLSITKAPTTQPTLKDTDLSTADPTKMYCSLNEMYIELNVRTDLSSGDTSLELVNLNTGDVLFNFNQFNPETIHIFDRCAPCGEYNLLIFDLTGDGISFPGGYTLSVDGDVLVSSGIVEGFGTGITFGHGKNCNETHNPTSKPSDKNLETPPPSEAISVQSMLPSAMSSVSPTTTSPTPSSPTSTSPTTVSPTTSSPTASPTYLPTNVPTFISVASISFHQSFGYKESSLNLDDKTSIFIKQTIEYYATLLADQNGEQVYPTCTITEILRYPNPLLWILVKYEMSFTSSQIDVTSYLKQFETFLNEHLERLSLDLQLVGVKEAFPVYERVDYTAPTKESASTPTYTPTIASTGKETYSPLPTDRTIFDFATNAPSNESVDDDDNLGQNG